MPEGPEIRRAADKISLVLKNEATLRISFAFSELKRYENLLLQQTISQVCSRGKAMLITFSSGLTIYSHNQLYGRWVTTATDKAPATNRQIRLSIATAKGAAWLLSASEIEVLDEEALARHPYLSKLGPDPLDNSVNDNTLINYWASPSFARRSLAVLMLDQSFLAGVGNYLRSEILFLSKLNPHGKLPPQRAELAKCSIRLFQQSYRTEGVTNDLNLVAKLEAQGIEKSDYRFMVFRREGKACYHCGATIIKESLAGRSLFWCPNCQSST